MKNKPRNYILATICSLVVSLYSTAAYSFTDQITTERIIRENKHFIDFINITITNFGDEKKEDFRKVYDMHFNAEVAFLQADYRRAFKRVYSSQREMVNLFEGVLRNYYLEGSKNILDKMAPDIIRSKNARAKHYLTLGYRDRTVGWTHYTIGDASNPKLYSKKLYRYEEAIKMTRRAKRYGFLALFESQKPDIKKKIFTELLKAESKTGNLFYNRFLDLNEEEMIAESGKNFREYDKSLYKGPVKKKELPINDEKDKKKVKAEDMGGKKAQKYKYENMLQRRIRFKKERRLANNLLNHEFDKAVYEIKQYVKDYHFKVIVATFDVVASIKKEAGVSGSSLNYDIMKIHLMDNYLRLTKDSVLNKLLLKVKVEDDISTEKEDSNKDAKSAEDKKEENIVEKKSADKKTPEKNGSK